MYGGSNNLEIVGALFIVSTSIHGYTAIFERTTPFAAALQVVQPVNLRFVACCEARKPGDAYAINCGLVTCKQVWRASYSCSAIVILIYCC